MHAYDSEPTRNAAMKPVWIVDDDRSIHWVLEKALAREGIPYKSFASAYEVMQALLLKNKHIDAVWAQDDDMALGAEKAIKEASRDKERRRAAPIPASTLWRWTLRWTNWRRFWPRS